MLFNVLRVEIINPTNPFSLESVRVTYNYNSSGNETLRMLSARMLGPTVVKEFIGNNIRGDQFTIALGWIILILDVMMLMYTRHLKDLILDHAGCKKLSMLRICLESTKHIKHSDLLPSMHADMMVNSVDTL